MNDKFTHLSDNALSTIHAGDFITLEEFIKMNNLDAFRVESHPKYQRLVTYALALANYTAGLEKAASLTKNQNSRQV
jgi:hypothetical protein